MIIQEILKSSVSEECLSWVEELERNLSEDIIYPYISRVNDFLKSIPEDQCLLLKNKFNGINNVYKMHDIISEIICAVEYKDYNPVFLKEEDGVKTPDIYLEKAREYIEVKRIQISDEEKAKLNTHELSGTAGRINKTQAEKEIFIFLKKKIREKIDRGKKQLDGKCGFIYLLYSIDFINLMPYCMDNINLKDFLKKEIESYVKKYSQENNLNCICREVTLIHDEPDFSHFMMTGTGE